MALPRPFFGFLEKSRQVVLLFRQELHFGNVLRTLFFAALGNLLVDGADRLANALDLRRFVRGDQGMVVGGCLGIGMCPKRSS